MSTPEQRLASDGVIWLRGWLTDRKTENLRRLSELIVDVRGSLTLKDGRADWSGRSVDYRLAMRDLFDRAEVPEDQLDTIQAAVRYHVGNLLRERAEVEELEAVGLSGVAPRERLAEARRRIGELRSKAAAVDRAHEALDVLSRETGAYEAGYKAWAQRVIRDVRRALDGDLA